MTKDFFISSPTDASSCSENKELDLLDHPLPLASTLEATTPGETGIVGHDADLTPAKCRTLAKLCPPRLTHSSLTLGTSDTSLTGSHTSFISMVDYSHEGSAFKERSRRKKAEIEAAASATLAAARAARSTSQSPATDLLSTASIPCFSPMMSDHTQTTTRKTTVTVEESIPVDKVSSRTLDTKETPVSLPTSLSSTKSSRPKEHSLGRENHDLIAAQDNNQAGQEPAGAILGSITNDIKRNIRLHQQLHRSPAVAIKKDQGDSATAFRYRKEMKQMGVVNELVETEENYIHDLGILCNVRKPLFH